MTETINYFMDRHGQLYRSRFPNLHGWMMTKSEFMVLAVVYGGAFMDNHRDHFSYDVVGSNPILKRRMEECRLPGLLFNYFDTHQDRLAEFQMRLDAAKKRLSGRHI